MKTKGPIEVKAFEGFRFAEKRQLDEKSDEDWMHV